MMTRLDNAYAQGSHQKFVSPTAWMLHLSTGQAHTMPGDHRMIFLRVISVYMQDFLGDPKGKEEITQTPTPCIHTEVTFVYREMGYFWSHLCLCNLF